MDIRRRIAQFLLVVAMAATSSAFSAGGSSLMLGDPDWCASSCGGTGACDPCGGVCVVEPCFGSDGNLYPYSIYCFDC